MNQKFFYASIFLLGLFPGVIFSLTHYTEFSIAPLYFFGRFCALTGLTLLSLQLILGNFHSLLQTKFSKINVVNVHIVNGVIGFVLLITHPLLFAISDSMPSYFLPSFSDSFSLYRSFGVIALYLLVLTISTSFLLRKLSFRNWKKLHFLNYAVLLFGFYHAFNIGSDLASNLIFKIFFIFLFAILIFSFFYRRYGVGKKFVILKKEVEGKLVTSLYYVPVGKSFLWKPGQYGFVTISFSDGFKERHPFTISSSPSQKFLRQSIKSCGEFSSRIPTVSSGQLVYFEGPYGNFTFGEEPDVVMIAGGIGITPFKSMIQEASDSGSKSKILLLYSARTLEDLVFYKELNECAKLNSNFKVIYTLNQEESQEWAGERSWINEQFLDKYVQTYSRRVFYVCGPPAMIDAINKILLSKGVSKESIKFELFSF